MIRKVFTSFLAPFALCAMLAACDNSQAQDKAKDAPPPPPKVTVIKPVIEDVEGFKEFTGRFEAKDNVEIRARVGGYLTKSLFEEGAIVKQGTPLYVIDPRPYEAALKKAVADVKVAESQIAYAQGNYQRAEALFKSGDTSAQLRDQRLQERDQTVAELERAKAAAEQARLDLAYTRISAPLTGRIGSKLVAEGNLVTAGQTILTTIMSVDPIYFTFDIDEKSYLDYARAHPDQKKDALSIPVSIALSDEKDYTHEGTVDFIDNAMNASTGSMRARAVLTNPNFYFTPGMFGRVRVTIGTSQSAVLIPDAALMIDQSRKYVYTVDPKGLVTSQTVETSTLSKTGLRIVTKGLTGQETIIVNGLQRAHDGGTVSPEFEQPAAPAADANTPTLEQAPQAEDAAAPAATGQK